ncbi:MAG: hypothetical protein ILM98_01650 [Kiritimatiellae bacterium]|nr:hypothetical protein [Kiritimatiellia bacterium]
MKASTYASLFTGNLADAVLLDAWLNEREADAAGHKFVDGITDICQDNEALSRAVDSFDGDIREGQIRILSKSLVENVDYVPYILVLGKWLHGMWLVMPFSPYGIPASPGEMATMIPQSGLRVLQAWNTRSVHSSVLARSFLAGEAGEKLRGEAQTLFRHTMARKSLPDNFAPLCGGPILYDSDPRRVYFSEFRKQFAPMNSASRELEGLSKVAGAKGHFSGFVVHATAYRKPIALAAGDKSSQTIETFSVPAHGVELDVKHTPSEKKVRIVIYKGGERDDKTLEGFFITDQDASPIGEIHDGVLVAEESALADGFLLINPETLEPVPLEPEKREGE